MKTFLCLFLGFFSLSPVTLEPQKAPPLPPIVVTTKKVKPTKINHQAAKAKLLGTHKFEVRDVRGDYRSIATVTEQQGVLSLQAQQFFSKGLGGQSIIDGIITEVNAHSFKFKGRVSIETHDFVCEREGVFLFRVHEKQKLWRMQRMSGRCGQVTTAVDIHFR
ncbi:MAG: hypothetical protein HY774_05605 [Acidobacteria bacterium]|nr:hypothetical protein [Acidobacteriota bacterium]